MEVFLGWVSLNDRFFLFYNFNGRSFDLTERERKENVMIG